MSDASEWYKWRVIITSTQQEDYVYRGEGQGPPVVGPGGEPIDTEKSRVVDTREEEKITVKEMETATGTYYQTRHTKIVCPPNVTTQEVITFPTDVNIISATAILGPANEGDEMEWLVAPDTTIGVLEADAADSSSILPLSPTAMDFIEPLFRVTLVNALDIGDFEEVGYVTDIDEAAGTVTVSGVTSKVWPAGTTFVNITMAYVDNVEIGPITSPLVVGGDKIGSSFVPKGRQIVCNYNNKSTTDTKNVYIYFNILYGRVR
jgi:hypothetical protein